MQDFSFHTCANLIMADGAVATLAEHCRQQGAQKILLVTDPGLVRLGLVDAALAPLQKAGITVDCFSEVQADPSEANVLAAVCAATTLGAELIIGFGGGSAMDVAKLAALLAHPQCTQSLDAIYGVDKITAPRLPLFQVPTTAGTGSEVTPIAIITTGAHTKAGVVSQRLLPDLALLDPQLTLGLPPAITAATGIDAMVHAIEAYTSAHKKNPLSDMLAREALRLLGGNLLTAVRDGNNLVARKAMLLGANLAGQAFANAPVAAVHALAYPLGGQFSIAHGVSNALLLTAVLRFNASHAAAHYAELAPLIVNEPLADNDAARCEQFCTALETLIADSSVPVRLRDVGIPQDALPALARDAMQQTRLLVNNPRPVSEADALAIYQQIY
ncbi:iron-containing alcohol dehydrogenase [Simiduia agarivorans]|uniref:Iron-containing alcohol dehydrogenase n=1 Tax=Simiduia agarivorans (strain DSM 21679 / JCM 13881 / BCRC 17597 / SA1) TaxID=1117647 RepID=K4KMI3_SIMAS|nr:iron-containing alcohol dehydrogenase [Simiduia agarivorans]AFV00385.1 iron-containing alcohol dehydrogenase [Simiduia agarivorans SA1 = DSM 21679]